MYCTQCGAQVPETAAFCRQCGAPSPGSVPAAPVPPAMPMMPPPPPPKSKLPLWIALGVLIVAAGIAAVLLLTGDKSDGKATPTPRATPTQTADPTPTQAPDGFEAESFTAYGNSYSITGYAFSHGDNGKTIITMTGTDYSIMPFRDGSLHVPVWAEFTAGGETFRAVAATTSATSVIYEFEATATPETIIFINSETEEVISTVYIGVDAGTATEPPATEAPATEPPATEPPAATDQIAPDLYKPFVGEWLGRADDIVLTFNVKDDGTGVYHFQQGGYEEGYPFALKADTKTFSVTIPADNRLGIKTITGSYELADDTLTLRVKTTFADGRTFSYTVPCHKI